MNDNRGSTRYADEPLDARDAGVLAALRQIHAAADPVPAGLVDDVKFALTVQALDAEVAELQRIGAEGALVRSIDYTRAETLTFTAGGISAMVTIEPDGPGVRIDGWLEGGPGTVELRERDRSRTVEVGSEGRFGFSGVAHGLVQLVVVPAGRAVKPVITPSFDV